MHGQKTAWRYGARIGTARLPLAVRFGVGASVQIPNEPIEFPSPKGDGNAQFIQLSRDIIVIRTVINAAFPPLDLRLRDTYPVYCKTLNEQFV